jgi:hypothetical protein
LDEAAANTETYAQEEGEVIALDGHGYEEVLAVDYSGAEFPFSALEHAADLTDVRLAHDRTGQEARGMPPLIPHRAQQWERKQCDMQRRWEEQVLPNLVQPLLPTVISILARAWREHHQAASATTVTAATDPDTSTDAEDDEDEVLFFDGSRCPIRFRLPTTMQRECLRVHQPANECFVCWVLTRVVAGRLLPRSVKSRDTRRTNRCCAFECALVATLGCSCCFRW